MREAQKARENEILWRLSNSAFKFAFGKMTESAREPKQQEEIEMRKYARCVIKRFLLLFIFYCSNLRGRKSYE